MTTVPAAVWVRTASPALMTACARDQNAKMPAAGTGPAAAPSRPQAIVLWTALRFPEMGQQIFKLIRIILN